ncbi:MAG: signal peptidase I, partial [Clostridiales bacterium]|nr:signal peptidase I [Clostridiales bacterium]
REIPKDEAERIETPKENPKKKKRKKPIAIIMGCLSDIISISLILVIVFIAYSAAVGDEKGVTVGPFRCFNVLTGSMEPTISPGSIIVSSKPKPGELKVGDIVTFVSEEDSKTLVTHRIAKTGAVPGTYTTRGDANTVNDREIVLDQIVGKHVLTIPFIGLALPPFATTASTIWLSSIVALFTIMLWVIKKVFIDDRD